MAGRPKNSVSIPKSLELLPPDIGAASCLKFLQEREAKKRKGIEDADRNLDKLIADRKDKARDGLKTDEEWNIEIGQARNELRIAEEEHKVANESLLKYERAVEPEKRDAGEKITQSKAGDNLTAAIVHLRFGWEQVLHSLCQNATRCKTPVEFYEMARPLFDSSLQSAIDTAVNEKQIDEWAAKAMKEGL